jgi:tetratricopeptide (TPR) repeat protein
MVPPAANLPSPNPEHRRVAAGMFERANQVVATGNFDYGIRLLRDCCRLDPANLPYRQALRRTAKAKYRNNLRGSWWAWLTAWYRRARLTAALRTGAPLAALEHAEALLARNPWDVAAQVGLAEAAEALGLADLAVWALEGARQRRPHSPQINRALARLYEQAGNFTQAIALWGQVARDDPADVEARQKHKDLAAHETIARGRLEEALIPADGSGPYEPPPAPAPAPEEGPVGREAAAVRARLQADPTSADLYLELARVYRKGDNLEQAHAVLREGLGATGASFALATELADLEIEPFRRNLALAERQLEARPDDPELRKVRVRLRKEVNTRELELFRRKADRQPGELIYRYEVGVRLLRAGQLDEAIQALQASRADARLRWQSLLYLGHCFKARNNWKLARRNFEEALENLPKGETANRKEVLFELARGHAEAGELEQALEHGHELANLDFAYKGIGRLVDEWEARPDKGKAVG